MSSTSSYEMFPPWITFACLRMLSFTPFENFSCTSLNSMMALLAFWVILVTLMVFSVLPALKSYFCCSLISFTFFSTCLIRAWFLFVKSDTFPNSSLNHRNFTSIFEGRSFFDRSSSFRLAHCCYLSYCQSVFPPPRTIASSILNSGATLCVSRLARIGLSSRNNILDTWVSSINLFLCIDANLYKCILLCPNLLFITILLSKNRMLPIREMYAQAIRAIPYGVEGYHVEKKYVDKKEEDSKIKKA